MAQVEPILRGDLLKTPIYTVTELVFSVKSDIERQFRRISVVGEISSFKPWRSGHWYFDLKDEGALLPAVMFRPQCSTVKFDVRDGLQVILTGRLSVYSPQSKLQIVVEDIEPAGMGALALAFEQLKTKLETEGLFAQNSKVPLPPFPKVVGMVTSPQGAAIRDMIRVLHERWPVCSLLIAGVRVQGEGSAQEIAKAIARLDAHAGCDVIIVGRGGGSLEDLWAFNEEVVARAIFACKTPVVSAVGHETDFTIADFVADMRCATPTHAAQTVVPDGREIKDLLGKQGGRLIQAIRMRHGQARLQFERVVARLPSPALLFFTFCKSLDQLAERLSRLAPGQVIAEQQRKLRDFTARIWRAAPHVELTRLKGSLADRLHVIHRAGGLGVLRAREKLEILMGRLHNLSPLKVLARGYAVVYKASHGQDTLALVSRISDIEKKDALHISMQDGIIQVVVVEKEIHPLHEDKNG